MPDKENSSRQAKGHKQENENPAPIEVDTDAGDPANSNFVSHDSLLSDAPSVDREITAPCSFHNSWRNLQLPGARIRSARPVVRRSLPSRAACRGLRLFAGGLSRLT